MSTAYEQKIYTKLEIDDEEVKETDPVTATLLLGATYSFSPSSAMNVTVGVGLTEDSPDVQVSLNFPIRFSF